MFPIDMLLIFNIIEIITTSEGECVKLLYKYNKTCILDT